MERAVAPRADTAGGVKRLMVLVSVFALVALAWGVVSVLAALYWYVAILVYAPGAVDDLLSIAPLYALLCGVLIARLLRQWRMSDSSSGYREEDPVVPRA